MELSEKIIETLEKNNFDFNGIVYKQDDQYYVEIGQYTPEGEDWIEYIGFDGTDEGFIEAIRKRAKYFDPNEEAEIWILQRGKNGVPDSIGALIDDAHWKGNKLEYLLSDLLKIKAGNKHD